MRSLRVGLLVAYLGAFLAVTTVWVVARLQKPANFAFPPAAPGWAVNWGHHFVEIRHWAAPVPTAQASDPTVQQAQPTSSGSSIQGGSAPAGLYAYSSGYYWAKGVAYAFRDVGFHYHVFWWITAPAPLLAVIAYRRHRWRMRIATLRCVECGYDLRATPDRCPECGRVTNAATSNPPSAPK